MERADRLIVELVEAAWPEAPEGFARAMFGGVGLKTAKGASFGLIADGVLYLKRPEPTTDDSIPWFAYERGDGKVIRMCYAEVAADDLESASRLAPLLGAARRVAEANYKPSTKRRRGKA